MPAHPARTARLDPATANPAPIALDIAAAGVNGCAAAGASAMAAPQQGTPAAQRCWREGVAQARAGRLAAARAAFERACHLSPRVSLYWLNLASVQRRQHQDELALASALRAAALDRTCRTSCHLAAELLRARHRHGQALAVLDALHGDTRQDAQHRLLRGVALAALGRPADAAGEFLQVLAVRPGEVDAYMQLGFCFVALRRFVEAAECFRTVTLVNPALLGAAVYAAHYAAWACDWQQTAADQQRLRQALSLQTGSLPTQGFSPFCLLSMDDDPDLHLRATRLEAARLAAEVRRDAGWVMPAGAAAGAEASGADAALPAAVAAWPLAAQALAQGRCRVGLVSADFRTHATSLLLVQTLESLDRSRFELLLYSHGEDDATPLRQRVVAAADRFIDCRQMTLAAQARQIREDGVTVLIDLSGYTTDSRLGLLALRPAPVQAVWLAYPGTLGAPWVDYLIGDPVITPMDHAGQYSERLVQLPLCYAPTDEQREHPETSASRSDAGLPEHAFVYACFNQSYKITEPVFSRWCRILHRVPGSVLWLLVPQAEIQQALRARAAERGIAPERLVFAPFVPTTEHLARLPLADVFLDTFPYGAHTTCSDALWMGLPVLTQVGRSFASRVAASLLQAVGLADLAVDSAEAYEEMAVRLAEDGEALCDIRDHLWDQRRDLPLFDNARFSAELGDVLGRMAGRWQQGLPPAALPTD